MRSINPWQLSAPPFIQAPSIFIGNSYLKSYDFFWYQINLNYNYLFDIIMMMMLMPIHVGVPWLSFLASLSGSRAHRDTCVPPITELWKFLGFKHCSLHSLSLSYLLLLSPSWTFSRESSTPLPITQHELSVRIHTNTTMRTQFLCAIHLVAFDKKFTWQGCTLLKTPYLDTWNDIAHESIKMSFWKEKKLSSYCFWF